MDNIETHKKGYAQAALLDSRTLNIVDISLAVDIEDAAQTALSSEFGKRRVERTAGNNHVAGKEVELAEFFLYGHAAHQRRHIGVHRVMSLSHANHHG